MRRVRGHARLLALMRWDRERRLLWPWGGVVGEGYAPDPRLGGEVLRRFPPSRGWLLADAGFDGKEVWGVLGEAGVRPVIRLRGGGEAREEARVRAREGWDPEVDRVRGVVEGVCGGRGGGGGRVWGGVGGGGGGGVGGGGGAGGGGVPLGAEALDGHGAGAFGAHRLRP